ncbi:MAG: T9SS type A sorting domain-containing protein [Candidatus Eisenbacteria bacterium]|uniref:T9SS type A sorting domain-containing protein n=1 Tax=Eiseniibacteriota bacterium TaxID=2212470 RepID=A0A849SCQ8_UNCEI|nr:T9SS type A sorting domain-containing protein [Candidatus Eisenbacteria bacterium]
MSRHIFRAAILVALILGASIAFAFSTGPPAARTGAFAVANKAAESNCTLCHNGNPLNLPVGQLEILDLPETYDAGITYPLRLRLTHTWPQLPPPEQGFVRWGFEIQAVSSQTGDSLGSWAPVNGAQPDSFQITKTAASSVYRNRRYLEHTCDPFRDFEMMCGSIREGNPGPSIEWNLLWTAPAATEGTVYFFAAGNSANGDGSSFGSDDYIFTTSDSMAAGGAVGVGPSPLDLSYALEKPFPNPMKVCTNIDFTIPVGGFVDLAVFDAAGRRVKTLMHESRPPGTHASTWSGRTEAGDYARNGIYFLKLKAPGREVALTQKIIMAR